MVIQNLTYEQIISVTQNPLFIGIILFIWLFVGIILYLIIAGCTRARLSNGQKLKKSMLSSPNAWLIPMIIWILQAGLILVLMIFPIWTMILK